MRPLRGLDHPKWVCRILAVIAIALKLGFVAASYVPALDTDEAPYIIPNHQMMACPMLAVWAADMMISFHAGPRCRDITITQPV
jgi:hypothetical protein